MSLAKAKFRSAGQVAVRSSSGLKFNSRSGFTLMEVMISSFILAVVMVGAFGALARGHQVVENARDETRVSQILQSEIEDIRTKNWTDISALPASASYFPGGLFSTRFNNRYTCVRTVTPRAVDQKEVRIAVNWTDNGGGSHSREYITWITKNGIFDYYYRDV